ncbi:CLUMA_CG015063, isoform A [Clunio marinus]|uniref:Lipase maturation factor n=1 Tax=Clunio marinus TaxID=568069 RepID=A0A1J1IRM9_9DIPT|nr:CLUMA_CG015063, isoform A [Clunio marinus]
MGDNEKFTILSNVITTRNLILRGFCGIYLCAFLSFYVQAEGLFSHVNGILPPEIESIKGNYLHDQIISFVDRPTWIRILKIFQVATFPAIELICIAGAILSFFGFVSRRFCILPILTILWTLYFSLVDISKSFHNQADDLLLEAGLVCILLAPGLSLKSYGVSDNVMMQLMRWVLFRFLFASGVVKLATGCPHWWNLTALKHHLLVLPLPTNLSFYAYYIPDGYLKLTTAFVNVSELLCPWFFFAPIRSLRFFAFYWQIFLQLCIIATGNYGFLNFTIIVMLLSLLDDSHFQSDKYLGRTNFRKVFSFILTMIAIFFIMIISMIFYKVTFNDGKIDVTVLFTKNQYSDIIHQMIKLSPFIMTISILNVFLQSCIAHPEITSAKGFFGKLSKIIHLLALTMIAISLVGCSTVPHGRLHPDTNISNTTIGKVYNDVFLKYHIVHEYGLHLRNMRSERLELGIQYTNNEKIDQTTPKQWKEYDVTYRPVNQNHSMPYAGLYLSRIDFKFFEAVGKGAKLENNLWLASLIKQLLKNNRAALKLLGHENLLKMKMPPKHIRVIFMKVSYVPREDADKNNGLWMRKILNAEYLPPMSITSNELDELVNKLRIPKKKEKETYPKLLNFLKQTRMFLEVADGHFLVNGIILASFLIMFRLKKY